MSDHSDTTSALEILDDNKMSTVTEADPLFQRKGETPEEALARQEKYTQHSITLSPVFD